MSTVPQPVDASAFDLIPRDFDGRASALCLHGLTGTPYEMRPIAEELVRKGVRCVGPVMAGHGRTASELARTSHQAWVALARDALLRLREQSQWVFVAGLSMGGLVTLTLAAENRADAVAVMGTPLWLGRRERSLIPLLRYLRPFWDKDENVDIQDEQARARHPSLDVIPLASVQEVMKLQKGVRASLSRITTPVFIGHGALDRTANPRDARTIFGEVNAPQRALHIAARSGHVVSVDYDGPELARAVADFFVRQIGRD